MPARGGRPVTTRQMGLTAPRPENPPRHRALEIRQQQPAQRNPARPIPREAHRHLRPLQRPSHHPRHDPRQGQQCSQNVNIRQLIVYRRRLWRACRLRACSRPYRRLVRPAQSGGRHRPGTMPVSWQVTGVFTAKGLLRDARWPGRSAKRGRRQDRRPSRQAPPSWLRRLPRRRCGRRSRRDGARSAQPWPRPGAA